MSNSLTPKIISVFRTMHSNLEKWYYTRELAKHAKVSSWTVSRQFSKFVKEGMVEQRSEGREKFYRLNLSNPKSRKICELFETEKRERFFRENRMLAWVLEDFTKRIPDFVPEIQSVVLFGSVARGESTKRSDIDVLVIVPDYDNERFNQLMDSVDNLANKVSGRHPNKLATVVMRMKDFKQGFKEKKRFAKDVLRDGIVLFGEGSYYYLLSEVI